jgi:hypothetical protein
MARKAADPAKNMPMPTWTRNTSRTIKPAKTDKPMAMPLMTDSPCSQLE